MDTAICTLFEGNYHYGVGALANSLYYHGFRGVIWAGYRGGLPSWANPLKKGELYHEYRVSEDLYIRFVYIETDYHFTNYKPTFMLSLWEKFCPDAEALFYFDPDIVIKCRWSFFEEWVTYGIALCEDVSSPILNNHPFRMAWRKMYAPYGFDLDSQTDTYVNGGFIGIKKEWIKFVITWFKIQGIMAPDIGGLQNPKVPDRTSMLRTPDQEALNITLMHFKEPVSIIGKEGMDIAHCGFTMSHSLGSPKPWKKQLALMALKGKSPRLADKEYWKYTQSPIKLYSNYAFFAKKLDLIIGKILGRIL
ncbi:MAG: hypothetical protein WBA57_19335 [Elainellaceae cyanobacterium]